MANPYFQFKQFTVYHDRCAMKVGTDGVLLGAWVDLTGVRRILDVGTGSGLIALMAAQRSTAQIEAIDIDQAACSQACDNVARSPWPERIRVSHQALQTFETTAFLPYDLVISNPPFFPSRSATHTEARAVARQASYLSEPDLLKAATRLLAKSGRLAVIYPVEQAERCKDLALNVGFVCRSELQVKPKHHRPVKRVLLDLQRVDQLTNQTMDQPETLVLEEAERYVYTPEFIDLIKDFYLKY